MTRGEEPGERRARAAALVDQRLRHAAADRETPGRARRRGSRRRARGIPGWCRAGSRACARTCGRSRRSRRRRAGSTPCASGSSSFRSAQRTPGSPSGGSPCGTSPSSLTPCAPRSEQRRRRRCRRRRRTAPPAGSAGSTCRARAATSATRRASAVGVGLAQVGEEVRPSAPRSLPCAPVKPNSLGSCVLARNERDAALKPIITVSETKLTIDAGAHQPDDERDRRDQERGARRQRARSAPGRRRRCRRARRRRAARSPT